MADPRPLSAEEIERALAARNGSNRLMAEYVIHLIDAERARHAALVEAARRMLDAEYVRDAGIPLNQAEERAAWAEYHEAFAALRAALDGEPT